MARARLQQRRRGALLETSACGERESIEALTLNKPNNPSAIVSTYLVLFPGVSAGVVQARFVTVRFSYSPGKPRGHTPRPQSPIIPCLQKHL